VNAENRFEVSGFASGMHLLAYNLRPGGKLCYTTSYLTTGGACVSNDAQCSSEPGEDVFRTYTFTNVSQVQKFFIRVHPDAPGATLAADLCVRSSLAACDASNINLHGRVLGPDGQGVADATVRLIAEDLAYTATTSIDGGYEVRVPAAKVPDAFVYSIYKATAPMFVPRSLTGAKRSGNYFVEQVTLEPLTDRYAVVEIEPLVHHLGDSNYSGSVNSQFQRLNAEGTAYTRTFSVAAASLNLAKATLSFLAKGSQCKNTVALNGKVLGGLPDSPADGSYSEVQAEFAPKTFLTAGVNGVTVQSLRNCPGAVQTDYDDFEFENIVIRFTN
jgi:hypothetical protein